MGGHGPHIAHNDANMKESDSDMQGKIQRVDLVKFNPNHFHMEFMDAGNMLSIIGGVPTAICGALGAAGSFAYYRAAGVHPNFYTNNMRVTGRLVFGLSLGLAFGYTRFGDRQRLQNAYVAERLRRRYPESMNLGHTDLWRLKGVAAPHEFYQWK